MHRGSLIQRHDLQPRLYQLERQGYISMHPNSDALSFGRMALLTPKGKRKLLD